VGESPFYLREYGLLLFREGLEYTVDNRNLLFRRHMQEGAPAMQRSEPKFEANEEV
jgi:hypothetical protein